MKEKTESDFSKMSAPALRALVNNGVKDLKALSKKTEKEILEYHGMGPASIPVLRLALKKKGMKFKEE